MTATTTPRMYNANRDQVKRLTRVYVLDILQTIAVALAIGFLISGILWVVINALEVENGSSTTTITLPEGEGTTTVVVFFSWLGIPLIGAVIAAFVHAIVIGSGYLRMPIANGATRRNVAISTSIAAGVGALVVGGYAMAVVLLERAAGLPPSESVFQHEWMGESLGENAWLVLVGTVGFFALLLAGHAVGAMFVRYVWIVGVVVLLVLMLALPLLAERFGWGWYQWLFTFGMVQHLILVVLAAGGYWFVLRRLHVP